MLKKTLIQGKQAVKTARVKLPIALALLAASAVSYAQDAPDVSPVKDVIVAVGASVGIIGAAVLLVYVGIKSFKWIRAAIS